MWYFAYGSNMDAAQVERRCPGARAAGPALLPGWRLAFDLWSGRRGGHVADILPAAGSATHGVLWVVTGAHLAALDRHEGVAAGRYRRVAVTVEHRGGTVEAVAYAVVAPGPEGPPARAYRALLVRGARAHALPAPYVALLEAVAVRDP